jgi:hypothetical protein
MRRRTDSIVWTLSLCFFILLTLASCNSGRKNGENETDKNDKKTSEVTAATAHPRVNVFIENSGSMDGFILAGLSDFKNTVGKVLVDLKYYYDTDSIQIYFIRNEKIKDGEKLIVKKAFESNIESNISDFADAIELKWRQDMQENKRGANTKLNNIFKTILDSTEENTISILISDCIYSIGADDALKSLDEAENTTYNAFLMKLKNDPTPWSTMIVQMESSFNGSYFPYTSDKDKFTHQGTLPYYICVVASQANMNAFTHNNILKLREDKGYCNRYILSAEKEKDLYYSILLYTDKNGRFKANRQESTSEYVHGIEDIDMNDGGSGCSRRAAGSEKLQFSVAVDLSHINVDKDYLLDANNYFTTDTLNFRVTKVEPLNKNNTNSSDWKRIANSKKKPTHKIVVTANGTAYSDFSIGLKRQMPQWIHDCSIINDTREELIQDRKTFGLEYWVNGISDAYKTKYKSQIDSYFEIDIKIKK